SAVKNTFTLNFDGGNDIPTFSLADLRACAERNDKAYFRRHFADKVVIFGTLLDQEDRKQTSKRFVTGFDQSTAPRCVLAAQPPNVARFGRASIAGVYVHATAVSNLIAHEALSELGRLPTMVIAIGFALLVGFAALLLAPFAAGAVYFGMIVLWTLGATLAFARLVVVPLSEPFIAGFLALVALISWRLVVPHKGQRLPPPRLS